MSDQTDTGQEGLLRLTGDRLDGWGEIAAYLGRSVNAAQRWEKDEGLPVQRHAHRKRGSVCASKSELDEWRLRRTARRVAVQSTPHHEVTDHGGANVPERGNQSATPQAAPAVDAPLFRLGVRLMPPAISRSRLRFATGVGVLLAAGLAATMLTRTTSSAPDNSAPLPRVLANDAANELYPSLSPDGRHVVYRWSRPDDPGLYIKPVDGSAPALPLRLDGPQPPERRDSFPKWSPDGRWIAFLREVGSAIWDVHIVAASGGEPRRLTRIASGSVSWMPGSETLAVVDRAASGEPNSVFLLSTETGARTRRLTAPPNGTFGDWHCAISPDGLRLALARYQSQYNADVYVTTLVEGESGLKRLTSGAGEVGHLEWTPDGTSVVFASHRDGRAALWKVPADPVATPIEPQLVAGWEGGSAHPTLSRDRSTATRLVYMNSRPSVAVWRWDLASPEKKPVPIARTGTGTNEHPTWSPDGHQLAFISDRSGHPEVWIADSDGGNARQLTFREGPITKQPRWSPDGESILFTSTTGGQLDLYRIQVDGSRLMRVTTESHDEQNGSWSRDGQWIYFRSNRDPQVRVWRMAVDRRQEPQAATIGESSEAVESLDGRVLYFTREAEGGLWMKPLPDGPETILVPDWHARDGAWDVTRNGILMLDRQVVGSTIPQPVVLFEFSTRALRSVVNLPVTVGNSRSGISASPAGSLLWSQKENTAADLMVLELPR